MKRIYICSPYSLGDPESKVFEMLRGQNRLIEFTGGLEAARLKPWMAHAMKKLRIGQMFFAYDTPDDRIPLWRAGEILKDAICVVCHNGDHNDTLCLVERKVCERGALQL